jgi:autotransporter-associated beta strand protein
LGQSSGGTGNLTLGASGQSFDIGTGNLTLNTTAASVVMNAALTNSGSLTKTGTGILQLNAANSFNGLTISEGIVAVVANAGVAGTLGSGNVTNNATLRFARNSPDTTDTFANNISGSGSIEKTNATTVVLTGSNSYTGSLTVGGGILELNSLSGGAAAAASAVSVGSGATLLIARSEQVNNAATITLSGGTVSRGAGVAEVFGNLNITAASLLDFGTGATGTLQFQNYSNTGSALVTVQNFFPGNKLQFTSTSFGTNNLSAFNFGSSQYSTGTEGSYFTITAIPEPSTYLAAAGLLALMLWPSRRRLLKWP